MLKSCADWRSRSKHRDICIGVQRKCAKKRRLASAFHIGPAQVTLCIHLTYFKKDCYVEYPEDSYSLMRLQTQIPEEDSIQLFHGRSFLETQVFYFRF